MNNKQLADKLEQWADALAESGGQKWVLSVPVREDVDPDCLMIEAAKRLRLAPIAEPVEGMRPLRRLDTMTAEEAENLCVLLCDSNRHLDEDSRVTIEDIQVDDMIYNDGGNLVDEDVAVAIEFSCRCFEGKAAVFYNGDIELYDDQDDRHHIENIALIVKYLIRCGFGLYDDESASPTPSAREAELESEVAWYKEILRGQSYSIWKGCNTDLKFDEWQKKFFHSYQL